jgi:hypothetical protein
MTLARSYFDDLYGEGPDPWEYRSRRYESRKRAVTMACLPDEHYATGFEPGCSIGVLTSDLAVLCGQLLAMDISSVALDYAATTKPVNVELQQGAVPQDWPDANYELVVISELGYYLDEADCIRLGDLASATATDLIAVHWRHPVAEYPLTGDEVHHIFSAATARAGMKRLISHREDDFLLDVWSHDPRSVALRTDVPHQVADDR